MNYGYEVLDAAHGDAALLVCERYPKTIHLLLTDVVMPRMSGHEVANRLAPLRPEMKVLFMSGYTDDAIVHHRVLDADTPFIQKPFAPDALARKVRNVLDGQGQPSHKGRKCAVETVRVLLADDPELVPAGIRSLLQNISSV